MSAPVVRRVAAGLGGAGTLVTALVLDADPAAAHGAGGAGLPAPSWLLGYGSVAVLLITAVLLRSSWPTARLERFHPPADAPPPPPTPVAGGLVGLALLALVLVTAVVGVASNASNPAPTVVLVVFWIGLPLLCVLLGDVFRWVNPFVTLVRLVDRRGDDTDDATAPAWVPAAFLLAFVWYLQAYYRPGSPRALAAFLGAYCVVALGLGLRWGHRWLATGEGFGALSRSVARLSAWPGRGPLPRGLAPLMVVWLGSIAFDVMSQTDTWADVLGSSRGWGRTLLNSVGIVWMTAIVAGLYLLVIRVGERGQDQRLAARLGVALVPLAAGWFLAHDLSLLVAEGQNAYILMSDPLGKGWDLFGTINHTIDYSVLQDAWFRWLQLALLVAGHVAAVVVLHDTALTMLSRRAAMRTTWAMTALASASVAAGVLLVLE
jgi:hypothetical protein